MLVLLPLIQASSALVDDSGVLRLWRMTRRQRLRLLALFLFVLLPLLAGGGLWAYLATGGLERRAEREWAKVLPGKLSVGRIKIHGLDQVEVTNIQVQGVQGKLEFCSVKSLTLWGSVRERRLQRVSLRGLEGSLNAQNLSFLRTLINSGSSRSGDMPKGEFANDLHIEILDSRLTLPGSLVVELQRLEIQRDGGALSLTSRWKWKGQPFSVRSTASITPTGVRIDAIEGEGLPLPIRDTVMVMSELGSPLPVPGSFLPPEGRLERFKAVAKDSAINASAFCRFDTPWCGIRSADLSLCWNEGRISGGSLGLVLVIPKGSNASDKDLERFRLDFQGENIGGKDPKLVLVPREVWPLAALFERAIEAKIIPEPSLLVKEFIPKTIDLEGTRIELRGANAEVDATVKLKTSVVRATDQTVLEIQSQVLRSADRWSINKLSATAKLTIVFLVTVEMQLEGSGIVSERGTQSGYFAWTNLAIPSLEKSAVAPFLRQWKAIYDDLKGRFPRGEFRWTDLSRLDSYSMVVMGADNSRLELTKQENRLCLQGNNLDARMANLFAPPVQVRKGKIERLEAAFDMASLRSGPLSLSATIADLDVLHSMGEIAPARLALNIVGEGVGHRAEIRLPELPGQACILHSSGLFSTLDRFEVVRVEMTPWRNALRMRGATLGQIATYLSDWSGTLSGNLLLSQAGSLLVADRMQVEALQYAKVCSGIAGNLNGTLRVLPDGSYGFDVRAFLGEGSIVIDPKHRISFAQDPACFEAQLQWNDSHIRLPRLLLRQAKSDGIPVPDGWSLHAVGKTQRDLHGGNLEIVADRVDLPWLLKHVPEFSPGSGITMTGRGSGVVALTYFGGEEWLVTGAVTEQHADMVFPHFSVKGLAGWMKIEPRILNLNGSWRAPTKEELERIPKTWTQRQ